MSGERQIFMDELIKIDKVRKKKEDKLLLGFDGSGWPMYAMKLKDILESIGFVKTDEGYLLPNNDENLALLDAYPNLLSDDGMAYGVDEELIYEADKDVFDAEIYGKKIKVFNLFKEKILEEE